LRELFTRFVDDGKLVQGVKELRFKKQVGLDDFIFCNFVYLFIFGLVCGR